MRSVVKGSKEVAIAMTKAKELDMKERDLYNSYYALKHGTGILYPLSPASLRRQEVLCSVELRHEVSQMFGTIIEIYFLR